MSKFVGLENYKVYHGVGGSTRDANEKKRCSWMKISEPSVKVGPVTQTACMYRVGGGAR